MISEYSTKTGKFNGKKSIPLEIQNAILYHTAFVTYSTDISLRAALLFRGIDKLPNCLECGKKCKINIPTDIPRFCSAICGKKSKLTKEKRQKTNLHRYGIPNPFSDSEKIKKAIQHKYGVDNISHLQSVREKISEKAKVNLPDRLTKTKKTTVEKYGVDNVNRLQAVKDKKRQTFLDNYGVSHYFKTTEFKERVELDSLKKHGVPNFSQADSVKEKIKNTKLAKYGNSAYNNPKLISKKITISSRLHWSDKTRDVLESKDQLTTLLTELTPYAVADLLSVAPSTIYCAIENHNITDYNGQRTNQYEYIIGTLLDELHVQYVKGDRSILNGKELDFYIPDHNLAIECNGMFWHSELMGKGKLYHLQKTIKCAESNVRLIHIWDYQFKNISLLSSMISHILGKSKYTLNARDGYIDVLTPTQYKSFLLDNHLQGSVNSKIKYGLFIDQNLVAVMGFGMSRFKINEVEMIRFAVKKYTNVRGAASKLFSRFLRDYPETTKVISYADRNFTLGNMYLSLGFTKESVSPPGYHYFLNRTVYNRIQFQKHKLAKKLENFSSSLSEWENMKNNGYNRFWDTGNIKYVYNRK